MSFFKLASVALVSVTVLGTGLKAQACEKINEFEGLIFDAGAFVAPQDMETSLDGALLKGVEKVVLYPHPAADKANQPDALEETFPDLVLRGNAPWSEADPVIWPEPLGTEDLGRLGSELARHSTRRYLLSHISRFDPELLVATFQQNPNLWLGLNKTDLELLNKSCGQGLLSRLYEIGPARLVFASFGQKEGWKYYKWTIKSLRKLAGYLPPDQADAILFRNAEELYNLAVNAP
ncbi:hypothetical protein [Terasakiella sp. SH-1]|uniref:hypothetical protein n=1 Tax=Terasakiella sp. SH-1 TaxID=2560057 RepID=UPI00107404BF|nr:hypothetical protein [Terasakiella sp. SH-1]